MLSDILPTGLECGVLNGRVQPGSTVAIVGCGPIGLATLLTAQFYSPGQIIMIDLDDGRLARGQALRCDGHHQQSTARQRGRCSDEADLGLGVDTAIEAVGVPATFALCQQIVAAGGTIANIGVHGVKVDLHLESCGTSNISITTRLVDTVSTPMLLKTLCSHKIDPKPLITHHFKLDQILDAYETFGTRVRNARAESHHIRIGVRHPDRADTKGPNMLGQETVKNPIPRHGRLGARQRRGCAVR